MIIILNGCPSAGKSSIAKEMQKLYKKPLLSLGIDRFWAMIPEQYKECGAKAHEGYLFMQSLDEHSKPIVNIKNGPFAEQFDHTMPHVIRSLADCQHDVIVDAIITNNLLFNKYVQELKNHTVYFIGIECNLDVLEKREKERNNRILGLARGHVDDIHKNKRFYNLTIDTTHMDPIVCAQTILDFIMLNTP